MLHADLSKDDVWKNRRCRHYIHPNLPVMGAKGLDMFSEVFIGFNNGHMEDLRPLTISIETMVYLGEFLQCSENI